MDAIKVTGCSMGCLYAEGPIDKCLCSCKGQMHGMSSGKMVVPARCTPSAESRCKDGSEGGVCACACKGANHAMYKGIADYKITSFATV